MMGLEKDIITTRVPLFDTEIHDIQGLARIARQFAE
jgi:hypothetical protein